MEKIKPLEKTVEWVVLEPASDTTIKRGFDDPEQAVVWIAEQLSKAADKEKIAEIKKWGVYPYDPNRTT